MLCVFGFKDKGSKIKGFYSNAGWGIFGFPKEHSSEQFLK